MLRRDVQSLRGVVILETHATPSPPLLSTESPVATEDIHVIEDTRGGDGQL